MDDSTRLSPERRQVLAVIRDAGGVISLPELVMGLELSAEDEGKVRVRLSRMKRDGLIERVGWGQYALPGIVPPPDEQEVTIARVEDSLQRLQKQWARDHTNTVKSIHASRRRITALEEDFTRLAELVVKRLDAQREKIRELTEALERT